MKKIREKGKKGGTHGGIFLGEGKNLEIYFTQESILYHVPNLDSVTWRLKYVQNKFFFGVKKIQKDIKYNKNKNKYFKFTWISEIISKPNGFGLFLERIPNMCLLDIKIEIEFLLLHNRYVCHSKFFFSSHIPI